MSRSTTSRLLANTFQCLARPRVAPSAATQWTRPFSHTTTIRADARFPFGATPQASAGGPASGSSVMQDLLNLSLGGNRSGAGPAKSLEEMAQQLDMPPEETEVDGEVSQFVEPYHLHVYSTKHNTHITVTRPNRNPIISVSCGNLGFKKANRHSYDAAHQLGTYVFEKLQHMGYTQKIKQLEVVLRDFGPGREAISKLLLGPPGKNLRGSVVRITDATKLKFGGTRSKPKRRLG